MNATMVCTPSTEGCAFLTSLHSTTISISASIINFYRDHHGLFRQLSELALTTIVLTSKIITTPCCGKISELLLNNVALISISAVFMRATKAWSNLLQACTHSDRDGIISAALKIAIIAGTVLTTCLSLGGAIVLLVTSAAPPAFISVALTAIFIATAFVRNAKATLDYYQNDALLKCYKQLKPYNAEGNRRKISLFVREVLAQSDIQVSVPFVCSIAAEQHALTMLSMRTRRQANSRHISAVSLSIDANLQMGPTPLDWNRTLRIFKCFKKCLKQKNRERYASTAIAAIQRTFVGLGLLYPFPIAIGTGAVVVSILRTAKVIWKKASLHTQLQYLMSS